ncbi:hypothetical protein RRG08_035611 [Elysia crispata]|uniref:Integrase zinc-binding domain-containing protein n=1 Tax=Elysia crispata TaxID=231223 RepID=A0AAE1EAL2_9GAST|nr:hypothetical protein RRG08_035611 [Elysia crispata]
MEELSQYDMEIMYRLGKQHLNADALSRMPVKEGCYHYQGKEILSDLPCGGCHQGTKRTKEKVRESFDWYGITHSVRNFILTCDVCNKNKKLTRHAKGSITLYHAGAPMGRVHLDFLGPLPITSGGNEYVLVMVDQFL